MLSRLEPLFLRIPRGASARMRVWLYRFLGMKIGHHTRIEGGGRVRRCTQIEIGNYNGITQGCWLWPMNHPYDGVRIRIGHHNYFNRNVMIDACGLIEIGDHNQFGPDVYMTDSNHKHGPGVVGKWEGVTIGRIRIGNGCTRGCDSESF